MSPPHCYPECANPPTTSICGTGVGDHADSWSFCPGRLLKFNSATGNGAKFKVFGLSPARTGDYVGTSIDLEKGEVRFYINGRDLGPAFTGLDFKDRSVYPAITLCKYQTCTLNFGTII